MAEFGVGDGAQGDNPQQYSDEAVAEFLKARQERIAVRRARIGDRISRKYDKESDGSEVSSLDIFGGEEGKGTGSAASGSGGGRKKGSSKAKDGKKDGDSAGAGNGGDVLDLKRVTADPLDVQIDESRKQLEQIILDGEALITNVRVAAECREKVRHIKQTETRKDRLERLQKEADECQTMYDDLKPNWNISGEKTLPMDLFEKIKAQMQASEELIMKKQDLIMSLQQEVEDNDFEYELNLEIYQKDVSLLGDRIDDCVDDMQSAFLSELNLIEDYTCRNREVFLEENQREWMDLLGDFQTMEESHLDERKKDAIDKFKSLNELYIQVKQECRAMRHRFEDDLRILIQELEQIKYASQLNMEKLQYNLAIVRKRYKENVEMKNMMKRLLLKFNDRFTTKSRALKKKMEEGKKEAKKILADIAKLEESLSQFGKKTLHLATSDWAKYMDMWMVSEEMVRERVKKLLDSEKFVFETQLGFTDAIIPEMTFMDDRPDLVTKYIMKKNSAYAELLQQGQRKSSSSSANAKKKSKATSDDISTPETVAPKTDDSCRSASLLLLPSDSIEFIPGPEPDPALQRRLMKHVAKVICDESGFLVEEELRKLLEPLLETERNLVNLDALLKALGINTVAEMQYLAHFILKRCRVTKGIISRISSRESAHLSEMNVSLEGIVGKNAMDDLDSDDVSSVRSRTPSSILVSEGPPASPKDGAALKASSDFKECHVEMRLSKAVNALAKKEKEEKPPKVLGETSLEILLPPVSRGGSPDDYDAEGACQLIPELKNLEDPRLSYGDFAHALTQCTPKCCSEGGSEDVIEEAVVEVEGDDELEEMLDEAEGEEDEEEEEEESGLERGPSKCSTCGGETHDHQDCSFITSEATVLSWIDPEDPPNKALKIALQKIGTEETAHEDEIIPISTLPTQLLESVGTSLTVAGDPTMSVGTTLATSVTTAMTIEPSPQEKRRPTLGEEGTLAILGIDQTHLPALENYGEPVRRFSEILPPPIVPGEPGTAGDKSTAHTTTAETSVPFGRTDSGESESQDTESIDSIGSSSNGSTEFMYIEPDEVIDALTEFCKDYNARITVELPTLDELIDRKLTAFKYPKQSTVMEYWERPVKILTSNSDDMWDTMQYCFEQFSDALIKRNSMVERFIKLYKQNQELGVLMKNHLAAAGRYSSSRPNRNPGFMHYGRFCDQ